MKLPVWVGYIVGGLQVAAGVGLVILGKTEPGMILIGTGLSQFTIHELTP